MVATVEELKKNKVAELKVALQKHGLSTSGKKDDLVDRLYTHLLELETTALMEEAGGGAGADDEADQAVAKDQDPAAMTEKTGTVKAASPVKSPVAKAVASPDVKAAQVAPKDPVDATYVSCASTPAN